MATSQSHEDSDRYLLPVSVDSTPQLQLDKLEVLSTLDLDEIVVPPRLHHPPPLHHADLIRVAVARTRRENGKKKKKKREKTRRGERGGGGAERERERKEKPERASESVKRRTEAGSE